MNNIFELPWKSCLPLLNIHLHYAIMKKGDLNRRTRRHSILVKAHLIEDGPKNPLKGISMKLLVAAFYAQFRVAAGRIGLRAACNGIRCESRFFLRLPYVVTTDDAE